jgi:murein L,D-transpeptidase YcbB/YkuD
MRGPRVALLRRRLGLPAGTDLYDDMLVRAVRRFEEVHGLAADGRADAAVAAALDRGYRHYERIIQANLERARSLPSDPGRRFVLVDTAGARLWLFEDGRVTDSMRAIVGKPAMATPEMAGLIRHVVLNPYWNIPPDLIRERVAKRILREGPRVVKKERLQLLTDWRDEAPIISAASVDWRAVAAGRRLVRVRQLPGPGNMMGDMKFMFPNKLDIYLHDTPHKTDFALANRRLSSGCVRVEDAQRLARWLFRGEAPSPSGAPEERVLLAEHVPVYITHLTAVPDAAGLRFQADHYGRDLKVVGPSVLAEVQLSAR